MSLNDSENRHRIDCLQQASVNNNRIFGPRLYFVQMDRRLLKPIGLSYVDFSDPRGHF